MRFHANEHPSEAQWSNITNHMVMLSNDNKVDDDEGITNRANIKKRGGITLQLKKVNRGNEKVSFHISTNEEKRLKIRCPTI